MRKALLPSFLLMGPRPSDGRGVVAVVVGVDRRGEETEPGCQRRGQDRQPPPAAVPVRNPCDRRWTSFHVRFLQCKGSCPPPFFGGSRHQKQPRGHHPSASMPDRWRGTGRAPPGETGGGRRILGATAGDLDRREPARTSPDRRKRAGVPSFRPRPTIPEIEKRAARPGPARARARRTASGPTGYASPEFALWCAMAPRAAGRRAP